METSGKNNNAESQNPDAHVIRRQMTTEEIRFRAEGFTSSDIIAIKRALRTLHSLEIMAVNIYRFQLTGKHTEHNRKLIAAMCSEMTHVQDFLVKLCEFGLTPSAFRWAWWIVGFVIGFFSKMAGTRAVLNTGIWVESKAVHHYSKLLESAPWDPQTRSIIEKNQADEQVHINQWVELLKENEQTE